MTYRRPVRLVGGHERPLSGRAIRLSIRALVRSKPFGRLSERLFDKTYLDGDIPIVWIIGAQPNACSKPFQEGTPPPSKNLDPRYRRAPLRAPGAYQILRHCLYVHLKICVYPTGIHP